MKYVPYGRQYIDAADIKSVSKSLKNELITTGSYVKKFENKMSKFLQAKFTLTCNSGTSALHLALMAIDLKKGDTIIMPSINFIAIYNMAKFTGAKIFLADVDPLTGQMTPKTLLDCIKNNKLKKIKVVVTMYLGGYPDNVVEFYKIKKKFNCYLIEDACHALGAKYLYNKKYLRIGSCNHSDISVFSLHPVKTITSGEGGIISTNNKNLYQTMINLRSHGIERNEDHLHWKYDIKTSGYNYRLSDINCALGLSQLKKINKFINYRRKIFNIYKVNLQTKINEITFPTRNDKNKPSYHLFLISLNFKKTKYKKDNLLNFLKKNKIICQYHYIPIYKFSVFNKKINLGFYKGAEFYYRNTISLPIFYDLKVSSQKTIINKIKIFLNK
jgi:dTDP-4-amino-4,6-dideoxygalactose transaminase